jgi:NADH-quinone oxidoreductase subunit H
MGAGAVSGWWLLLALVMGIYAVAVLEEWSSTGRLAFGAPLLAGLGRLARESIIPRQPDRLLYETGPILLLVAAVLAAAVLPVAPGLIATDLATGALFVNAALAYVMVALIMTGWGPNAAYALIAGWRFLGQLIAYSMLIVMPLTAVAMRAQSLATVDVVTSQTTLWNIAAQPLGFVLFWLAGMAVAFLPPFDLPVAPGELAGGVLSEYSGVRLATLRLARLVLVLTVACTVAVFFLGGWLGPLLAPWAWTGLKSLGVAGAMFGIGRFVPRLSPDALLEWAWKLAIPLALVNILWVGITLLLVAG